MVRLGFPLWQEKMAWPLEAGERPQLQGGHRVGQPSAVTIVETWGKRTLALCSLVVFRVV